MRIQLNYYFSTFLNKKRMFQTPLFQLLENCLNFYYFGQNLSFTRMLLTRFRRCLTTYFTPLSVQVNHTGIELEYHKTFHILLHAFKVFTSVFTSVESVSHQL